MTEPVRTVGDAKEPKGIKGPGHAKGTVQMASSFERCSSAEALLEEDAICSVPLASIQKLVVGKGRLSLEVALSPDAPRFTDARLAELACRRCPALPAHTCINSSGPTFGAVMQHTPVPHLLEHLIIDAQVRDPATEPQQRFVGTTAWTDQEAATAHIEVNFFDDIVALRAVSGALALLSDILAEYENGESGRR